MTCAHGATFQPKLLNTICEIQEDVRIAASQGMTNQRILKKARTRTKKKLQGISKDLGVAVGKVKAETFGLAAHSILRG